MRKTASSRIVFRHRRLSAFIGGFLLSLFLLPAAADLVLVRGTGSVPAGDVAYAESVAKRLDRWLTAMTIPHRVFDDDAVTADTLKNTSTVILSCHPKLPRREFSVLKRFVAEGGKLIVFYSSDSALAGLMNVKLGDYLSDDSGQRWRTIRFEESAFPHAPARVSQESRNIRPVYPIKDKSRVIAWWENVPARQTEPALVRSDNGIWMTHILLDDGDTENKEQMFLSMIAPFDPEALRCAAMARLNRSSRLVDRDGFEPALKTLARRTKGLASEETVTNLLPEARRLAAEADTLFKAKQYWKAIDKSRALSAVMTEAYARIQTPKDKEFRGIWDITGTGLYPGDWKRTCAFLADNGFTDLLTCLIESGTAHYGSKVLPTSDEFQGHGDQLTQSIEAAHASGLRIHAWKMCWRVEAAPDSFLRQMKRQQRLQVTEKGDTIPWLCPSNPENLKYEKDAVRELLANGKVDGIHLDFIRYRDAGGCGCRGCRQRFETELGRKLDRWPIDKKSADLRKQYNRWRCDQITRLVRDVSALARQGERRVQVSAAVYGYYPGCTETIAQDWGAWLKDGLVDFVCPMNYADDLAKFKTYLETQTALPGARGRIISGIGVIAAESRLTAPQVIDQVVATRDAGLPGFVLFSLNRAVAQDTLPYLRMGLTAPSQP